MKDLPSLFVLLFWLTGVTCIVAFCWQVDFVLGFGVTALVMSIMVAGIMEEMERK